MVSSGTMRWFPAISFFILEMVPPSVGVPSTLDTKIKKFMKPTLATTATLNNTLRPTSITVLPPIDPKKDHIDLEMELKQKVCKFRYALPRNSTKLPLVVALNIVLHRLESVDERNQIVRIRANYDLSWEHPKMTWDPAEWGGITQIYCNAGDIFVPDLSIMNPIDVTADDIINFSNHEVDVIVVNTGLNIWTKTLVTKTHCYLNVDSFPYDIQECKLVFTSWIFHANELDFTIQAEKANPEQNGMTFIPNEEWEIRIKEVAREVHKYVCCPDPFTDLHITYKMKRKPIGHVINLVVPCVVLSALSLLTFIIPEESGEKIGFCMELMLAMTVFQQLTADSLPNFAVPFLSIYFMIVLLMNAIALVLSVTTLKLWSNDSKVPRWVEVVIIGWIGGAMMCHKVFMKELKKVADIVEEKMEDVVDIIEEKMEAVADKLEEAADAVADKFEDIGDAVAEKFEDLGDNIQDMFQGSNSNGSSKESLSSETEAKLDEHSATLVDEPIISATYEPSSSPLHIPPIQSYDDDVILRKLNLKQDRSKRISAPFAQKEAVSWETQLNELNNTLNRNIFYKGSQENGDTWEEMIPLKPKVVEDEVVNVRMIAPQNLALNLPKPKWHEYDEEEEKKMEKEKRTNNQNWRLVCRILNRLFLLIMCIAFVFILAGFKMMMQQQHTEL